MADPRSELSWLLDDLTQRVAGIQHAIVLSADGLAMGGSRELTREDTEHLSAISAGSHSLALGAGTALRPRRSAADHHRDGGRLPFRHRRGAGGRLAVLAAGDAELGLVTYEMALHGQARRRAPVRPAEGSGPRTGLERFERRDGSGSRAAGQALRAHRRPGAAARARPSTWWPSSRPSASFEPLGLVPEHLAMLTMCRRPTPVADVAAQLEAAAQHHPRAPRRPAARRPRDHRPPQSVDQTIDERIYREVLHGIRRL